jgi:Gluconate 2-dehydrogenase subunit 3
MNRSEFLKNTAAGLGLAISASSISAIFVSCAKEVQLDWKPIFLKANQAATIAEIAETILPKTKTPGAKDLGVPQFIDKMVNDTMDKNGQEEFLKGLETFESQCESKFGKSFIELAPKEREVFLMEQEKENPKSGMSLWGINLEPNAAPATFYKKVKGLTLFGFYTSQGIGEKILAYDPIPGEYIPCMPLNGQNAWNEG